MNQERIISEMKNEENNNKEIDKIMIDENTNEKNNNNENSK